MASTYTCTPAKAGASVDLAERVRPEVPAFAGIQC
jgi:hypothetical protein